MTDLFEIFAQLSSESAFLEHLAQRLPATLESELARELEPELSLSSDATLSDFIAPLRSFRFRSDPPFDFLTVLVSGLTTLQCGLPATADAPAAYKTLYLCALYLRSERIGEWFDDIAACNALGLMARCGHAIDDVMLYHSIGFVGRLYRSGVTQSPHIPPSTAIMAGIAMLMSEAVRRMLSTITQQLAESPGHDLGLVRQLLTEIAIASISGIRAFYTECRMQ